MYRYVLLSVFSCVLLTVQAEDDVMKNCGQLLHHKSLSCCKKVYVPKSIVEELKECMQVPVEPRSCEQEICVAKKKGFASDDGTINKTKLKALFDKDDEIDKDLRKAILEDCVEGDLSLYGPPDMCDLKKLHGCVHLHLVVDCPDWSNDGHCSGMAEAAEKCDKALT